MLTDHPLARLRDVVERGLQVRPGERCEMCAEAIAPEHRHVVDTVERTLKCLCQPCFLLFSDTVAAQGRFRQVPTRYAVLEADGIDDPTWDALAIPVALAFFFHSSAQDRPVAFYPGPAGATESLLPLEAWQEVLARNPSFAETAADVEAVMVRRTADGTESYVVPIDACYELAGRLRTHWSGFDGGAEARAEIDEFFRRVKDAPTVPELSFDVLDAHPDVYGTDPTILFKLRIAETSGDPIHTMMVRVQIQIDAQLRRYDEDERRRLVELFGAPDRWGETLRPFNWTHAATMLQGFRGSTETELAVPCTYDFDVAAAKYLHGLRSGSVPLSFLFSGTVISRGATGYAVTHIPWHKECTFPLPIETWRQTMDLYWPGGGWIRVRTDTLDALQAYKTRMGFTDWDGAFDALLSGTVP